MPGGAATATNVFVLGRCAFAIVLGLLVTAPASSAAVFPVGTTDDGEDAVPGDGACSTLVNPRCTLRAAIEESNALAGPDQVNLAPGTYSLGPLGELDVSSNIVVEGLGTASNTVIRKQGGGSRVFEVGAGGALDLRDATVRDGVLAAPGAGISSEGTLVLRRAVVKANQAFGDTPGGGVFSGPGASLTIVDSVIGDPAGGAQANRAGAGGAGILAAGSNYAIRDSAIVGNRAASVASESFGGGGFFAGGSGVIVDSTVSGNSADGGGGIAASDAGGSIRIERSTLRGNAAVAGSAIFSAAPLLQIVNSTLSANAASLRGAVFIEGATTLTHTTLAGNSAPAPQPAGIWTQSSPGAEAALRASILDNAGDRNCGGPGDVTSAGANVDSGTTCGLGGSADIAGAEPRLGPLASNGGPTQTRAIAATSPARDAVTGGCPAPATDQRGVARPQGPACDSGAFELVPEAPQLELSGKGKQRAKKLTLDVSCGIEACSVELAGKGKVPTRAAVAAKAKKLKLKPKGVDVAAGETETVRLKFKRNRKTVRKVRALLKQGGKKARKRSRVTVDATAAGVGGADTATHKIKLRR